MLRTTILSIAVFVLVLITASAGTIHVPGDYPKIQEAINAAANGDTLLVAAGTYYERINFKGKAILVKSSDGPAVTVIYGNDIDTVVKFINGEGLDSILEGFTVTKGKALQGAGIYCDQTSPTIRHNIITENGTSGIHIDGYGGGIFSVNGSPNIHDNVISKNNIFSLFGVAYGGGAYVFGGTPVVRRNTIVENSGGTWGGGLFCSGTVLVEGNIIARNNSHYGSGIYTTGYCDIIGNVVEYNEDYSSTTFGYGGGIMAAGYSPNIEGNLVRNNQAHNYGGGIFITNTIDATVTNNTVFGNTTDSVASIGGGGLYIGSGSTVTAANNIIRNNWATDGAQIFLNGNYGHDTLSIRFSNVEGGQAGVFTAPDSTLNWQDGMIDQDPLFVDPSSPHDDLHLFHDSPCRDSGDNSAVTALEDFEGDPRIAQGTVDMGADEFYTHLYHTGIATPGEEIHTKLVGLPGTSPVGLILGTGILENPVSTAWGSFHLEYPWFLIPLVPIPADGVLVLPATIPFTPPAPYDLPEQALIGLDPDSLTNLDVLEVR
jgi:parallel beta-helix repeat protein